MRTALLLCLTSLLCIISLNAQNGVNLHQVDGSVLSYAFEEKPVITYEGQNLHLATETASIDFPLAELERITFSVVETSIGELHFEGWVHKVFIYRIDGKLIKITENPEESFSYNMNDLAPGTYIIKKGDQITKFIKK